MRTRPPASATHEGTRRSDEANVTCPTTAWALDVSQWCTRLTTGHRGAHGLPAVSCTGFPFALSTHPAPRPPRLPQLRGRSEVHLREGYGLLPRPQEEPHRPPRQRGQPHAPAHTPQLTVGPADGADAQFGRWVNGTGPPAEAPTGRCWSPSPGGASRLHPAAIIIRWIRATSRPQCTNVGRPSAGLGAGPRLPLHLPSRCNGFPRATAVGGGRVPPPLHW